MASQGKPVSKKRGRPSTGIGRQIGLRLRPAVLAQLDRWIAQQPGKVTRPEAIRRLIERGLAGEAADAAAAQADGSKKKPPGAGRKPGGGRQ